MSALSGDVVQARPERSISARWVPVLRMVTLLGLLLGGVQAMSVPVPQPLTALLDGLERGQVRSVEIETFSGEQVSASGLEIVWSTGGRAKVSTYALQRTGGPEDHDESARVRTAAAASPTPVEVTRVLREPIGGFTWGPGHPALVLSSLAALVLLVGGPAPHLATRWAWFWLGTIPLAWIAFVVLEPVPPGSRPSTVLPARRLTGGWALLAGLAVTGLARSLAPWSAGLLWNG